MNLINDIKAGLKLKPLRAWWKNLWPQRRVRMRHVDHASWANRVLNQRMPNANTPEWRIRHNITTVEEERRHLGKRPPLTAEICASCMKRGWHWEDLDTGHGAKLRRKRTCLGNGEYHGIDDWDNGQF